MSALAGYRDPDERLRLQLMEALGAAEDVWPDNPRAHAEQAVAMVHLDLYGLLADDGSHGAYSSAIDDAIARMREAAESGPSTSVEVSRYANAWYALGFREQALGRHKEAIDLYQLASRTAMAVPSGERDLRVIVLIGTNIACCADTLGLDELASRARERVENVLRMLEG